MRSMDAPAAVGRRWSPGTLASGPHSARLQRSWRPLARWNGNPPGHALAKVARQARDHGHDDPVDVRDLREAPGPLEKAVGVERRQAHAESEKEIAPSVPARSEAVPDRRLERGKEEDYQGDHAQVAHLRRGQQINIVDDRGLL